MKRKKTNHRGSFTIDGRKFKWHEDANECIATGAADGKPITAEWFGKNLNEWRRECEKARQAIGRQKSTMKA